MEAMTTGSDSSVATTAACSEWETGNVVPSDQEQQVRCVSARKNGGTEW